jgi:hypothetical protein
MVLKRISTNKNLTVPILVGIVASFSPADNVVES